MDKVTMRKRMLTSLFNLGELNRKEIEKQLHKQLFQSSFWKKATVIGLTLSKDLEWNTQLIVKQAWQEGKQVCVPKSIHETRELHFYQIDRFSQVEVGYYDLEEPIPEKTSRVNEIKIELLIVPGIIFTREGYRIGFGGGYYDRFLTNFLNKTISLLHTDQLVDHFPIEEHDIPVNYLITEEEIIDCKEE